MSPDLSKAQALMNQAKAQGVKTPINVLVYSTQGSQAATNRMALLTQELKPLGINVSVKYFERAVQFQQEGVKGTPNDIADEGWLADFPDPYDFVNILLNGEHILAHERRTTSRSSTIRRTTRRWVRQPPPPARPAPPRTATWPPTSPRTRRRGRPGPTRQNYDFFGPGRGLRAVGAVLRDGYREPVQVVA